MSVCGSVTKKHLRLETCDLIIKLKSKERPLFAKNFPAARRGLHQSRNFPMGDTYIFYISSSLLLFDSSRMIFYAPGPPGQAVVTGLSPPPPPGICLGFYHAAGTAFPLLVEFRQKK